jgi:hypothetical protein
MAYLYFGTLGRILAIEPMVHRDSKLWFMGFFNISINFLFVRVPSCRIFEFWDLGRIGSRPQPQMAMSLKLKMILTLFLKMCFKYDLGRRNFNMPLL